MQQLATRKRVLSVFALVMITVTSVDSIRNLPATAMLGSELVFFYALAALTFLIPTALVSAELATALPYEGGIYVWVKHAFGKRMGYLAIWFQWIENIMYYPTLLSFIAGTVTYLIDPSLAQNRWLLVAVILIVFWAATFINLFGMKISAAFSAFCGIVGLIVPMVLIIGLGAYWLLHHYPSQVQLNWHSMLPHLHHSGMYVALSGIILSFCGMEITTVYAQEVENPQKDYPRALLIATLILLSTLVLGSLAIAIVVPGEKIGLTTGLIQAYDYFFKAYHLHWLLPVCAFMMVCGGLGTLSNWIIAPCKGLMIAAQDGNMPAFFGKANKHDAPTALLFWQGILTSVITCVFLLLPFVNNSYWLLTALAAQLYMLMYIIMFVTGIYLSFKEPNLPRTFRVPGGKWGMCLVAGLGILACTFIIIVSFFSPEGVPANKVHLYTELLSIGLLSMILLPFGIRWFGRAG